MTPGRLNFYLEFEKPTLFAIAYILSFPSLSRGMLLTTAAGKNF